MITLLLCIITALLGGILWCLFVLIDIHRINRPNRADEYAPQSWRDAQRRDR